MHTPRNPAYEADVCASFNLQAIMHLIGATLTTVQPGHVVIDLPYRPDLTQQHGFFHAGIISTIADSAGGSAALSLMPAGVSVLSVEFKVNLLSPADGELLSARADVIRAGKTLTVCQSNVYVQKNGQEKLCAMMQMTLIQTALTEG